MRARPLVFETLIDRAVETDERLRELARREGHEVIEVNPAWYGLDAIHIRRRAAAEAWARMLAPGTDLPSNPPNSNGPSNIPPRSSFPSRVSIESMIFSNSPSRAT